jgi:hypothetical protein
MCFSYFHPENVSLDLGNIINTSYYRMAQRTQSPPSNHNSMQAIQSHYPIEFVLKHLAIIKSEVHSLVELLNDKVIGKKASGTSVSSPLYIYLLMCSKGHHGVD